MNIHIDTYVRKTGAYAHLHHKTVDCAYMALILFTWPSGTTSI